MLKRGNGMEESRIPRATLPVLAGVIEFTQNQCNESENGFMDKVGWLRCFPAPVARARPHGLTDALNALIPSQCQDFGHL
jgi:hypothetical protein